MAVAARTRVLRPARGAARLPTVGNGLRLRGPRTRWLQIDFPDGGNSVRLRTWKDEEAL